MFSPQRWHHVWVRSARDESEYGSSFGGLHVSEQRIATMDVPNTSGNDPGLQSAADLTSASGYVGAQAQVSNSAQLAALTLDVITYCILAR